MSLRLLSDCDKRGAGVPRADNGAINAYLQDPALDQLALQVTEHIHRALAAGSQPLELVQYFARAPLLMTLFVCPQISLGRLSHLPVHTAVYGNHGTHPAGDTPVRMTWHAVQ